MTARAILTLLMCNLVWALNVVVSKIVVSDLAIPPLFYAGLRSAIVVAVLIALLRPVPAKLWQVMVIGLAISGGSFALLFVGLLTTSPSAAGIVSLSGAPLTVIFAILFLGERIRWRRGIGIALTLAGVVIAMGAPSSIGAGPGVLFVLASAVVGALGAVFFKRLEIDAKAMQAWAALASMLVLLPLSVLLETGQSASVTAAPLEFAAALAFAAIIVSILAHTAYYRLLQTHDANLIVPFTLLTPLLTVAFGAWLTGDEVGIPLLAGGALALAGVAIIVLRPSSNVFKPLLVRPRL